MASDEILERIDEQMRRGNELIEQIRAEAVEREQRYREDVQITREVIRRNEIAFNEGSRLHHEMIQALRELHEDSKAHTKAIFRLLDRLGDGPEPAGA